MPRSQRQENFIDNTFTIMADLLLRVIPTPKTAKQAFAYYRDGLAAQSGGEYAEALINYYESLRLETDPFDRSYILYNIGLIHTANGRYGRALEYYFAALDRNPTLTQALNNVAVLYYTQGLPLRNVISRTCARTCLSNNAPSRPVGLWRWPT